MVRVGEPQTFLLESKVVLSLPGGLGEIKTGKRGWFRPGTIEVHIGEAISFGPEETEAAITARLHYEVERLMGQSS